MTLATRTIRQQNSAKLNRRCRGSNKNPLLLARRFQIKKAAPERFYSDQPDQTIHNVDLTRSPVKHLDTDRAKQRRASV